MNHRKLRILGAMTGTSCDGLDVSCLEFENLSWRPLWSDTVSYPASLKARVFEFQKPETTHSSLKILELERDLGIWYAKSFRKLLHKRGPSEIPDLIANHGQTVAHFPAGYSAQVPAQSNLGMTWQLGDGSRIATATGISVVNHFREGDLAAGGQGAPMVPAFHRLIAESLGRVRSGISIHNLGGISNLSYFGPKGVCLAFDTGPANLWIDAACERVTKGRMKFDRGGKLAALSTPDQDIVEKILRHPYFKKSAPKSTGRDEFPFEILLSQIDAEGKSKSMNHPSLIATATQITIRSIAEAYSRMILGKGLPLKQILLCGGGAKNLTLLKGLRNELQGISIQNIEEAGLDSQYIESQAFAYLGYLSLFGIPVGGTWTGAKGYAPPGQLIPGKNWKVLMKKAFGSRSTVNS